MNCRTCLKESVGYREKRLSDVMKDMVEAHLATCQACSASYRLETIIDTVIAHEKEMPSNPFLSTRIMGRIETLENNVPVEDSIMKRVFRPAIILSSLAAAIFFGVLIGNISFLPGEPLPLEMSLINDTEIEWVNFLSND